MLQIRPNCELCDRDLAADSSAARICSYECTFCADCVETELHNVCPNCGGGFTARPIRPKNEHRRGSSREHQPPSPKRVHSAYSREQIRDFVNGVKDIPAEQR
jgi:hypothetical protein